MPSIAPAAYEHPLGDSPATDAAAVTKSDATVLNGVRGLYVGGTGDVNVVMQASGATVLFSSVPAGAILPICVSKVKSTSTTATNIVALK